MFTDYSCLGQVLHSLPKDNCVLLLLLMLIINKTKQMKPFSLGLQHVMLEKSVSQ